MAQYWGDIEGGTPLTLDVIVNADATAPILYQWFKNGVAIAGAVNSVYNFIAEPEDSHASYTVFVQNPCGDELSEPVLLGVVSDQPFCKLYECDSYYSAVKATNPLFYHVIDEAYDTGVVIDEMAYNDGSRNTSRLLLTDPSQVGFIDECNRTDIASFGSDSGGNNKVHNAKTAPDDSPDDYMGLGDDCSIGFTMNLRDTNPATGTFCAFQVNSNIPGGNGATNAAWNILMTQADPPIFQFARHTTGTDPYHVRLTTPELGFSFNDKQHWLINIHIKITEASLTMKIYVDGTLEFSDTTIYNRDGAGGLLSANPVWQLDYNFPNPLERSLAIGYVPWGSGGPTPMTSSHFHGRVGEISQAQVSSMYAAWLLNYANYVDPNPNCQMPSP